MVIPPTDIQIVFTNYEIITYFFKPGSCSEHFISIKHRIFATFPTTMKLIQTKIINNAYMKFHNL